MLPQPPEGYQPTQQKKPNWFQRLAQVHKDAAVDKKVRAGEKRLKAWQKSQRKKGFGPHGKIEPPVAAADPNQPKIQTKPKPAAKAGTADPASRSPIGATAPNMITPLQGVSHGRFVGSVVLHLDISKHSVGHDQLLHRSPSRSRLN